MNEQAKNKKRTEKEKAKKKFGKEKKQAKQAARAHEGQRKLLSSTNGDSSFDEWTSSSDDSSSDSPRHDDSLDERLKNRGKKYVLAHAVHIVEFKLIGGPCHSKTNAAKGAALFLRLGLATSVDSAIGSSGDKSTGVGEVATLGWSHCGP